MVRHSHTWFAQSYQLSSDRLSVVITESCSGCGKGRTTKRPNKRLAQN